jgi:hypothetical protein
MTVAQSSIAVNRLPLDHLQRLTDDRSLFEHAKLGEPRREHGYCLDDTARALEFAVREWAQTPTTQIINLTHTYLAFVEQAITANGSAHNRMDTDDQWTDLPAGGDWWGRAVGALGTTAAVAPDPGIRERAIVAFRRASHWVPGDLRTRLYAAVGASEALAANVPGLEHEAREILAAMRANISADTDTAWPWPERRLRYGNGIIPEALLAVGAVSQDPVLVERGLAMLDFLLEVQIRDGHLSLVGQGGWRRDSPRPQFDQQPIEAVSLATACAQAFTMTGLTRYRDGVALACRWFLGENDASTPMVDVATGAGYDGLTSTGRNLNQGAESTLAALTTFQAARRCGVDLESA